MRILVVLIFLSTSAMAQNFAPVGAMWHSTQLDFAGPNISFLVMESVSDTTINGLECRKLIGTMDPCTWTIEYVFDRNDSVFQYHDHFDEFVFLYDFNASTGDQWIWYENWDSGEDSVIVEVDSVSTWIIDGESLTVVYTHQTNQFESWWVATGPIIERIGNLQSLTPYFGACDPMGGGLRCYSDSLISFEYGPYECEEVINDVEEVKEVEIDLFPNPVENSVALKFPDRWNAGIQVRVVDFNGRSVYSEHIRSSKYHMNVSSFESGIYFLECEHETEIVRSKLIIR